MATSKVSSNNLRNGRVAKSSSISFNDKITYAKKVLQENKKEKDLEAKARPKNVYKNEMRAQIEAAQHAFLTAEAKTIAIDAYKIEIRQEVIASLKDNLRDSVIVEMKEELRDEVIRGLQRQHEVKVIFDMRERLREEVIGSMRRDLHGEVIALLKSELFEKVTEDLDAELRPEFTILLKEQVKENLRREMKASVREELRTELKQSIEENDREHLEREIEQDIRAHLEPIIAAELEAERDKLRGELKELVEEDIRSELVEHPTSELVTKSTLKTSGSQQTQTDVLELKSENITVRDHIDNDLYIPNIPVTHTFLSHVSETLTVNHLTQNTPISASMPAHTFSHLSNSSPPQTLKRSYHSSFASEVEDDANTSSAPLKRQRSNSCHSNDNEVDHSDRQQRSTSMITLIEQNQDYFKASDFEEEDGINDANSMTSSIHSDERSHAPLHSMAPFGTYAKYGEEEFGNESKSEGSGEAEDEDNDNADDEEEEDDEDDGEDIDGLTKHSDDDEDDDAEEPMHYYHPGLIQEEGDTEVFMADDSSEEDEEDEGYDYDEENEVDRLIRVAEDEHETRGASKDNAIDLGDSD